MRLKLATKLSAAMVAVVALAASSSVLALLSVCHVGRLMENAVRNSLPSLRAAEALEIALLEQRGLVDSFIEDNADLHWLEELQRRRQDFHAGLAQARKTAHTSGEQATLDRLEQVYREYDTKRDQVIALGQRGDTDKARSLLSHEVNGLSRQVDRLSAELVAENQRDIDSAATRAQSQIRRTSWLVGGLAGLTIALGAALLWLFFRAVFFPLRKVIADARDFAGEGSGLAGEPPEDELHAVDVYLHFLTSKVADTRSSLEESRDRLMDAERSAAVGKLAASGMAHEVRNPLTAMKMWLFSIRKDVGRAPELDRKFKVVLEEIARLENVVDSFLEFSRPPPLKLQAQSASLLIDETLELFGHRIEEERIRLVRDDAVDLPPVMADAEQLKQVFLNLLDNAVDATPQGGEIRVLADAPPAPGARPMVVVRVQDAGPGMPPDVRERIFEPFYTTKEQGTGLGLCIAAGIMARHQGQLVLESSSDEGTSFAVWIPVAGKEADEQNPRS